MASFGQNIGARSVLEIEQINAACGQLRRKVITWIPGQEMIYVAKEEEAKAALNDLTESLDPIEYPLIAAEIGITAPTLYEVAQVILNKAYEFRQFGAQIETLRLGAIGQIENATTFSEITVAAESFQTGLESLMAVM